MPHFLHITHYCIVKPREIKYMSRNYMYSTVRVNREVVSQLTHIFLILADENFCVIVHSMLKNEYFQRGGHDPEILAQIRDLEYEAQRMQATQRPQGIKENEYFSLNICSCD